MPIKICSACCAVDVVDSSPDRSLIEKASRTMSSRSEKKDHVSLIVMES